MNEVVIYSSRICPYCMRAKSLLEKKSVSFREISVDGRPDIRQEMIAASGQRTVPQIWVGDTHIGGCDDLYRLEYGGELGTLLAENGITAKLAAS